MNSWMKNCCHRSRDCRQTPGWNLWLRTNLGSLANLWTKLEVTDKLVDKAHGRRQTCDEGSAHCIRIFKAFCMLIGGVMKFFANGHHTKWDLKAYHSISPCLKHFRSKDVHFGTLDHFNSISLSLVATNKNLILKCNKRDWLVLIHKTNIFRPRPTQNAINNDKFWKLHNMTQIYKWIDTNWPIYEYNLF